MNLFNHLIFTILTLTLSASSTPVMLNMTAEDFLITGRAVSADDTAGVNPPSPASNYYVLVGNGNPHQNFVITQKGGTNIGCPGSTTQSVSHTLGWSISGGVNSPFNSLGFDVSNSQTYGTSQTFSCGSEIQDICILVYQAVTAFTVHAYTRVPSTSGVHIIDKGIHTVYAPNAKQQGNAVSRGINVPEHNVVQCDGDVDRSVLFYCGPPGGPEYWNGKGLGPFNGDYLAHRVPSNCYIPIEAYKFLDP